MVESKKNTANERTVSRRRTTEGMTRSTPSVQTCKFNFADFLIVSRIPSTVNDVRPPTKRATTLTLWLWPSQYHKAEPLLPVHHD